MAITDGWGFGPWGASPWGSGTFSDGGEPPTIFAIDPEESAVGLPSSTHISVRVVDHQGVEIDTLLLSVGGITYVRNGVAINGATICAAYNEQNGFSAQVDLPGTLANGVYHDVNVTVTNVGNVTSIKQYTFQVGTLPRFIQVRNPCEGILIAFFNQAMRHDKVFKAVGNWKIEGVSDGAAPLKVVEVVVNSTQPDQAILRYEGGGSTYRITAYGVVNIGGEPLEDGYDSVLFDIVFDEQEKPRIHLFDTIFGVIGVSQNVVTRRTMDGHVAERAIAMGMNEQFRLKMQTFDGTESRTGKPGIRRT